MNRLFVRAASALVLALSAACHVDASVKASTGESSPDRAESDPPSEPAPAPAPVAPAPVAVAEPVAPPTSACPLSCFEPRGSLKVDVSAEELTQLRASLEPVLGRMRGCATRESWLRYGSPVVNLRIAPDGTLNELGVDPHHGHDSMCFDEAGRGGADVTLSLPGRQVIRCVERCQHTLTGRPRGLGSRRRDR